MTALTADDTTLAFYPVPEMVTSASYDANAPVRTYTGLEEAFRHFNAALFGGQLPPCLITLQRHHGAYGYFSGDRFALLGAAQRITDEIALNPATFPTRTPRAILSTLVHEMAHLWQHHFGRRPRSCYHDRQWAAKMVEIGLIPSSTGQPGGKQTGQRVSHYIQPGGPFDLACAAFLAGETPVFYSDRAALLLSGNPAAGTSSTTGPEALRAKKAASKTKYTCPCCHQNAWAKPETNLLCGDCNQRMTPPPFPN